MKKVIIAAVAVVLVVGAALVGCGGGGSQEQAEYTLPHGELLDVKETGGTVVVKAKIEPSLSDKMTVDQNYYNVSDYIKKNDMDGVNEIQYWAVADMTSGDEGKVVSFTLDRDAIDGILAGNIVDIQIGNYADDLWVLPSLLE